MKILILALFIMLNTFAQEYDKIYTKNKTFIEGNIIQVTKSHIEIDPVGEIPFLRISRDSVSVLIYKDNTVVKFDDLGTENTELKTMTDSYTIDKKFFFTNEINNFKEQHEELYEFREQKVFFNPNIGQNIELKLKGEFKIYQNSYVLDLYDLIVVLEINDGKTIKTEKISFKDKYRSEGDRVYDSIKNIKVGNYIMDFGFEQYYRFQKISAFKYKAINLTLNFDVYIY